MASAGGWWRGLFGRRRRYDDLAVSIEEHIEERTDELVAEGLPREEAAQRARREFGNVTLLTERSREAWQWQSVEQLLNDARLTLRRLAKAPGFTATVLLTLAIGIGANTAVFSVVNRVVLRPLPYPQADRLVSLHLNAPGALGLASFRSGLALSASMDLTFSAHNRTLESMGVWFPQTANVTGLAKPEEVHAIGVSEGVLETFGVGPVAGRWFNEADQDPRGAKSVMLSYGYWQRKFGGDPAAVGRRLEVDAVPRTIVGVMPRGFRVEDQPFDVLVPLAFDKTHEILAGFAYQGVGRLKPGVSIAMADADLRRLINVWMDSWTNGPGSGNGHWYENWKISPALEPLQQQVIGNVASVLWVVMGTIGLVLLIACTNLANLLLVRAESRHLELSIRAALGAGRMRIARELLMESLLLGLAGGALAVGVAYAGLRLLVTLGPADLPRLTEIALDWRSVAVTVGLALFSGLVLGLIPAAKHAWRRQELAGTGGRTASASRERHRARNGLVVAQVAMSLVLLVSATLMIRTFARMRNVEPGFADAAHVQTIRISIPDSLIHDPERVLRTENDIANKLAALPGVTGVGFTSGAPMQAVEPDWNNVYLEGKTYNNGVAPLRLFERVSPGYFHAMGTRIVAGRDFTWDELYGARDVAILSERMAREEFGSAAAAVGKGIRQVNNKPWQKVIGVVEDVRLNGVDQPAPATVYWGAMMEIPWIPARTLYTVQSVTYAVHSANAGSEGFLHEVQQAVWSVNANLPVASPVTMQQIASASMARTSFTLVMLAMAGSMALLLGIVGIYGVIAYAVAQRRREIGIRLALGAQRGALRWMFVRTALVLTGIGVAIGIGAAAGLMQLMKSLLFGVSPMDPVTYVAVTGVLAVVASVASYVPARRAAAADPVEALRAE